MDVIVTAYGNDPKLVTKADSIVRDGYRPDVWVLCEQLLGENDDDMVIQLRNDEGDNWLVDEKGLRTAVLQQDCIYVTVEHETENAVLLDLYGAGTVDGLSMRNTVGEVWLPRSQITSFELKDD